MEKKIYESHYESMSVLHKGEICDTKHGLE